jgi:hypothetical protein
VACDWVCVAGWLWKADCEGGGGVGICGVGRLGQVFHVCGLELWHHGQILFWAGKAGVVNVVDSCGCCGSGCMVAGGAGVRVVASGAVFPPVSCGWYWLTCAMYWLKGVLLDALVGLGSLVSMGASLLSIWVPCIRVAAGGRS